MINLTLQSLGASEAPRNITTSDSVALEYPSNIILDLGALDIVSYGRQGSDLVVDLADGE